MAYKLLDPLAQSFTIDQPCILTKVEIFVKSKDQQLPLFCQIRSNENGFPGKYIVPFSDKMVYPKDIVTSNDSSLPTVIRFTSPVFMAPGEYSLCLGSDSKRYQVYVSELDTTDLTTGKRIVEQPYMGSLFKSQNATTWTPVQLEDLKFNMYRAIFNTSTVATMDFNIDPSTFRGVVLEENPIEVFNGSNLVRIHHFNHGMTEGSFVRIQNIIQNPTVTTVYGIDLNSLDDTNLEISNVTFDSYTVTATSNATSNARFGGKLVTATRNLLVDGLYPVTGKVEEANTKIEYRFKGTYPDYTQDSDFVELSQGTTELKSARIITNEITKEENLSELESFVYRLSMSTTNSYVSPIIDKQQMGLLTIQNLINNPDYDSENILTADELTFLSSQPSVSFTSTGDSTGVLSVPLAYRDLALTLARGSIATITDSNVNNSGEYRITAVSLSGDEISLYKLSGSTDTNTGTYSMVVGKNFIAEESPSGGSVYSKYITRKIDFANPSTAFNLRLDVNRPTGTGIAVYYKIGLVGDSGEIGDNEFTRINNLNLPVSLDDSFTEVEAQIDDLSPYQSIVFKIAFTSNQSSIVPKCKNLRAIALA